MVCILDVCLIFDMNLETQYHVEATQKSGKSTFSTSFRQVRESSKTKGRDQAGA